MNTVMAVWPDIWDGVSAVYVVRNYSAHPKYRATTSALVSDQHIALQENDMA